jgi:serine/threonine protein kinase
VIFFFVQAGLNVISDFQIVYLPYKILSGIAYLHRQEFTHCDMKPENIILCFSSGRWWVRIIHLGDLTPFSRLGEQIGGTKCYDPPEVRSRCGIICARDIHSMGLKISVAFRGSRNRGVLRLLQKMMVRRSD